jgi:quinol monooxygenase YgiN
MILAVIRMKVLAEKRKELSQTIALRIGSLRTENGCRRCDFYRSMEDENELCILEEWDIRENLNRHLKSERFRVLRGAMNLLQEPYEKEGWDGRDQERDEQIGILNRRASIIQTYPGG